MDFGKYKNYSWKYIYQSLGDISTKKILNSSIKYNSFIFGSSRTTSLYACYLQSKVPDSRFFHYANWNETIGGIHAKMKLIDSLGYKIDNVFVYMDTDLTFWNDGSSQNEHFMLSHENKYIYYFTHFRHFIFPTFDFNKLKILLGFQPDAATFPNSKSDLKTNDAFHTCSDSIINHYGTQVFTEAYRRKIDSLVKCGFLYVRPTTEKFTGRQISAFEEATMHKIKKIFEKHHTRYYIVITPLYDQLKFDSSDMQLISKSFGDRVFDFSGINDITNNQYNYHDRVHFLPYISKNMADKILEND